MPSLPKTHWIETDLFGLFGTPLVKSISPAMHNANFRALEMNAVYYPFEIGDEAAFRKVLSSLESLRFRGGNVTMPFKQKVVPMLDSLEEMGELCGAINTIRIKDGKISGTNTDGTGFVRSLREQGSYAIEGKTCALFGSGGAARGVSFALLKAGISRFHILDIPQSAEMMKSLASDLNAYKSGVCSYSFNDDENVRKILGDSQLVVNATSAGMLPNIDTVPFNAKLLAPEHFVADVVYVPADTRLLKDARAIGCKTLEGYWMTIWQGAEAFEYWTGKKADTQKMTEVMLHHLNVG